MRGPVRLDNDGSSAPRWGNEQPPIDVGWHREAPRPVPAHTFVRRTHGWAAQVVTQRQFRHRVEGHDLHGIGTDPAEAEEPRE
ncbi:hypothetical protein [Saccharopolyspora phatthalungensis]|uniref:Uncharacterized protein n=1 Tax=Saccharopolyspora phatthalungensis TaxID=664693 RepID=A0A840Q9E9_9PSEU|nr:hypothetical protein [Saccharopolyspora phatthalungensis]MBB5155075.1 hypothetical protein [Saccharopolyspora phatthalungensis]